MSLLSSLSRSIAARGCASFPQSGNDNRHGSRAKPDLPGSRPNGPFACHQPPNLRSRLSASDNVGIVHDISPPQDVGQHPEPNAKLTIRHYPFQLGARTARRSANAAVYELTPASKWIACQRAGFREPRSVGLVGRRWRALLS